MRLRQTRAEWRSRRRKELNEKENTVREELKAGHLLSRADGLHLSAGASDDFAESFIEDAQWQLAEVRLPAVVFQRPRADMFTEQVLSDVDHLPGPTKFSLNPAMKELRRALYVLDSSLLDSRVRRNDEVVHSRESPFPQAR